LRRIAISGHRGLPPDTAGLVDHAVRAVLAGEAAGVIGLSLLADGADQIVASALLDLGGHIEAVIPATRYREGLPPGAWPEYDRLLAEAETVQRLGFTESTSEAHMAASELMLRQAMNCGPSGMASRPVAMAGPPMWSPAPATAVSPSR
jgi:hypothetical protein